MDIHRQQARRAAWLRNEYQAGVTPEIGEPPGRISPDWEVVRDPDGRYRALLFSAAEPLALLLGRNRTWLRARMWWAQHVTFRGRV